MPTLAEFSTLRYSNGGHPLTRSLSQRIGAAIAWAALSLGRTPNQLTVLGAALFAAAAVLFAGLPDSGASTLICLGLLQLAYGVDCADGQLARATGQTSAYGAWLDVACDYFRNVVLAAAIAAWLARNGIPVVLALAAAGTFIAGAAIQLHTVTVMRQVDRNARLQTQGTASAARAAFTALIDSATVLLVLALLRSWPAGLAVYIGGVGIVYFAVAALQAHRRLR